MIKFKKPLTKRQSEVFEMRQKGMTFREIGQTYRDPASMPFGISPQSIEASYKAALKKIVDNIE